MAKKWEAERKGQPKEPAPAIDYAAEATKINAALQESGLALIDSETLGEYVYFAKDTAAARKAKRQAVVYTLDELRQLASIDRAELKRIHMAKKLFSGTVVDGEPGRKAFDEK